ncbi:hypothetical protein HF521_004745, partial [Silurus meridionalis]
RRDMGYIGRRMLRMEPQKRRKRGRPRRRFLDVVREDMQSCVLNPLLFTLLTHDCLAMHSSNHIIKFADDKTVVGLISKNDESAYRERAQSSHSSLIIDGSSVEIIKNTKFLGVHLVENFTWSLNTSSITKKAQQHFYFLRRLRKAHLSPHPNYILQRDRQEHPEQLHHCLFWKLHHLGSQDSAEDNIYITRCIHKANSILDDPTPHSSLSYNQERECVTVSNKI